MDTINYVISVGSQAEAAALMADIGVADEGIEMMVPRTAGLMVRTSDIDALSAGIVKQEMLFLGGDAALPASLYGSMTERGDALLIGTAGQLADLAARLSLHHGALPDLGAAIATALANFNQGRGSGFKLPQPLSGRRVIMGILNVTPDSFHDGDRYSDPEQALARARALVAEGAGIIDVGGESTRPGSGGISEQEELRRVLPVIEAISGLGVPVSIDTSKAAVAREALRLGAAMINDITALRGDQRMAGLAAEQGCPLCLMHMQGTPADMQQDPRYDDVIGEIARFFHERVSWAQQQGIFRENIIIDPGIGFGKKLEHNLEVINHLDGLLSLGLPVAIGASRKSFLGTVLARQGTEARLAGTVATTVLAYEKGAQVFRVHDVRENRDALTVAATVREGSDVS